MTATQPTTERRSSTSKQILAAARRVLLESGFAAMSTRKVADLAEVPLSQIHYHFRSKEQLILAMLREENESLVRRQSDMFALDISLSERWNLACDYLDADIESGYVRVLQEMMAAGWSSPDVREAVNVLGKAWTDLLTDVVERARAAGARFGPFPSSEIVALVAGAFLGAESMLLLGRENDALPIRSALRRVGEAIALVEKPVVEQEP
ncbi:MAG TPA: TetR family transcriptional regulator [Ilumatobacter sp.]|nr:TetR family transcriptional regulator [Ilumatobacter sp.]